MESGSPGGGLPPHAQTALIQPRLGEKRGRVRVRRVAPDEEAAGGPGVGGG